MAGMVRALSTRWIFVRRRRCELVIEDGLYASPAAAKTVWGELSDRDAAYLAEGGGGGDSRDHGRDLPARTGGDRRSDRIEAHRDYLLGLIRRAPDMTLLEIQERLVANCGERFSSSVLWRFFDRCNITFKKSPRMPRSSSARTF